MRCVSFRGLIIDDSKSRDVAFQKNLDYQSTLQIILELYDKNSINYPHFKKNLNYYGVNGWISNSIINEYKEEGKLLKKQKGDNK